MLGGAQHVAQVILETWVFEHVGVNRVVASPVCGICANLVAAAHLVLVDCLGALLDIAGKPVEGVLIIRVNAKLQLASVGRGDEFLPGGNAGKIMLVVFHNPANESLRGVEGEDFAPLAQEHGFAV